MYILYEIRTGPHVGQKEGDQVLGSAYLQKVRLVTFYASIAFNTAVLPDKVGFRRCVWDRIKVVRRQGKACLWVEWKVSERKSLGKYGSQHLCLGAIMLLASISRIWFLKVFVFYYIKCIQISNPLMSTHLSSFPHCSVDDSHNLQPKDYNSPPRPSQCSL